MVSTVLPPTLRALGRGAVKTLMCVLRLGCRLSSLSGPEALPWGLLRHKTQEHSLWRRGRKADSSTSHTTPCSAHCVPTLPMRLSPPVLHQHPEHQRSQRQAQGQRKTNRLIRKTQVVTHGHTCSTATHRSLVAGEAGHGTGKLHLPGCSQVLGKGNIKDNTQLTR